MSEDGPRSESTIAAELTQLRSYLDEAPPHHAGGRPALLDRMRRLERELAAVRGRTPRRD